MLVPQLRDDAGNLLRGGQCSTAVACHPVVVDDCTRECLALVADTSISGIRVACELPMQRVLTRLPITKC